MSDRRIESVNQNSEQHSLSSNLSSQVHELWEGMKNLASFSNNKGDSNAQDSTRNPSAQDSHHNSAYDHSSSRKQIDREALFFENTAMDVQSLYQSSSYDGAASMSNATPYDQRSNVEPAAVRTFRESEIAYTNGKEYAFTNASSESTISSWTPPGPPPGYQFAAASSSESFNNALSDPSGGIEPSRDQLVRDFRQSEIRYANGETGF